MFLSCTSDSMMARWFPGEAAPTWSSVPVTSWIRINFTLLGAVVLVPVLVAPFHAEK
jgi:hypothetical protein